MSKSRQNRRDLVTNWLNYYNDVLEDYPASQPCYTQLCTEMTELSSPVNDAETEVLSSHIKCGGLAHWLTVWLLAE